MKLNAKEQVLYDFFVTFGKAVGSIGYPITILAVWTSGDEEDNTIMYPEKEEVVNAYCCLDGLDKPLYEAIKTIKGWK
ncbi:hypothetical protein [Limosilactobacillus reuteri]|uniref:hypothetical protein n=1 Tax=Limosilactobacillus reuteri TaxID=1598 RepID=UPI002B05C426|nr:hypothetical protein [Limosilactobacillus reuteri]